VPDALRRRQRRLRHWRRCLARQARRTRRRDISEGSSAPSLLVPCVTCHLPLPPLAAVLFPSTARHLRQHGDIPSLVQVCCLSDARSCACTLLAPVHLRLGGIRLARRRRKARRANTNGGCGYAFRRGAHLYLLLSLRRRRRLAVFNTGCIATSASQNNASVLSLTTASCRRQRIARPSLLSPLTQQTAWVWLCRMPKATAGDGESRALHWAATFLSRSSPRGAKHGINMPLLRASWRVACGCSPRKRSSRAAGVNPRYAARLARAAERSALFIFAATPGRRPHPHRQGGVCHALRCWFFSLVFMATE